MPSTFRPYSSTHPLPFAASKRVQDLLDCAAVQTCITKKVTLKDTFLKKTDTERFHIFGCSGSEVEIMDLLFAISFIVKPLNHYSHHVMSFQ